MTKMTYKDFYRLKLDASECDTYDDYLAECGGSVDESNLDLLPIIYDYGHNGSLKSIREAIGLSRINFCREYSLPLRTIEEWDSGNRKPPAYVADFIAFSVISDL